MVTRSADRMKSTPAGSPLAVSADTRRIEAEVEAARLPSPRRPGAIGPARSGVALIAVTAVMVMIGIYASAIIAFHLATRRTLDQSQRRRQAEYLARAGIEFAMGELLAGRNEETSATYQPLENGEVRTSIAFVDGQPDVVRISSRATLERENRQSVVREITRRYRVVRDAAGKALRCEFLAFEFETAEGPAGE